MTDEPCPQCGGRKVIAVGLHEIPCAACADDTPAKPATKKEKRDGTEKPAA